VLNGEPSVLKKVPVNQLTIGVFVHGFDESWLKHPFWRSKFLIKDASTLREVQQSGIPNCWIDVSKGQDIPAQKPPGSAAAPAKPERAVAPKRERRPLSEELQEAARLRARSAQAMRKMFAEVRLGKAIEPGECVALVDDVVESINRHPDALLSLARLKTADEYTYMHSVAVCALMVSLGRQLGLDDTQCRDAGMAGMLHDLGKAAMPQDILNKPGKLTDEEFEIIQTHPAAGAELLGRLGGFEAETPIVRAHHERFTGGGYPDNISGEQIPLEARILMVCDVYDALTSPRVYRREPWTSERAVELLQRESGTTFDPQCVDALLGVLAAREPVEVLVLRSKAGPAAAPRTAEA